MDNVGCQSLFFISLPELRTLCVVKVIVSSLLAATEIRTAQRTMCRQILLLHQDVLSSPVPGTLNQISVVMTILFYKSGKFQAYVQKHGATMTMPETVIPAVFQTCFSYTLIAKLAPSWNQVGHLLIQGKDFLSQRGKQSAVVMDINVSENQLCISLEVCVVRLPPPELEDFNISESMLKRFDNDNSAVIQRHSVLSNWCYVLPSMKMGQIISISHIIPSDSPFQSYRDLQLHWKNLYGYILPEDLQMYCSVYFRPIGEQLFTYPLSCIRSQPVQYFPRVDLEGVLSAFLTDLKTIIPHTCGFPLKMTSKALYATQDLTRSSVQKMNCKLANLTGKRNCTVTLCPVAPKKSISNPETCATENSHKVELKVNQLKTSIFSNLSLLAEDGNTRVVEKKAHSRKHWKTSEKSMQMLYSNENFKKSKNSSLDSQTKGSTRIIPIFKGKLLQMDRQTTKALHGKKKQNASQYLTKVMETNITANLSTLKPSSDQANKSLHDVSLKNTTNRTLLQPQIGKTNVKCAKPALKEKNKRGGHVANDALANGALLDSNTSEIKSRGLNLSLISASDASVHHASSTSQHLNKSEVLTSNNKEVRKTASQITRNTASKRTHASISHSNVKMGNRKIFQNQTSQTEEATMNSNRLSHSVHKSAQRGRKKESQGLSNQHTIKTVSHHEQFNYLQDERRSYSKPKKLRTNKVPM